MQTAANYKVLVVDDDPDIVELLQYNLTREGYEVSVAENGKKAIDMAQSVKPDVILMDVMMPGMDGYETTRAIRKMSRFKNLPIIAVTAKAMKGDRDKCLAAGASDYITKPVDVVQLLSLMRVWLHR